MRQIAYRVEASSDGGKTGYYLVKDIRVKDKKAKITKFIGTERPDPAQALRLSDVHRWEIENKIVAKKVEMSSQLYHTDLMPAETAKESITTIEELKFLTLAVNQFITPKEAEASEKGIEADYIHGTTSIEGNSINRQDTRRLLEESIIPEGKSLREINEIQNFRNVKRYRDKFEGPVTLEFIRKLHGLIMNNIDQEAAGEFRRIDRVGIDGRDFLLSPAIMIESELDELIKRYYERLARGSHPFMEAVLFHHGFERIHPFTDGDGRVGREVLNFMLMAEKYPRLLFIRDRELYLKALARGDDGKEGSMCLAMIQLVITQRMEVTRSNLKRITEAEAKGGQTKLIDFGDGAE